MSVQKRIGRALSGKLTRVTLDRFIAAHATGARTLDIGAQNGPYAAHFPHRVGLDIRHGIGVGIIGDAQALGIRDASFPSIRAPRCWSTSRSRSARSTRCSGCSNPGARCC